MVTVSLAVADSQLLFLVSPYPGGQNNGAPPEILFPRAGESSGR